MNMDIRKQIPRRPWRSRRVIAVGAAAMLCLIGGFALVGMSSSSQPTVDGTDLWIDAATRGEMLHEIRATGTLIPKNVRWIAAQTSGTVQEVLVLPGTRVEADTVLLRLSNPAVQSAHEAALAARIGAEADAAVQSAELDLKLTEQRAALARAESAYQLSKARTDAQTRAEAAGAVSKMELRQSEIAMRQDHDLVRVETERVSAQQRNYAAQLSAIRARRAGAQSTLDLARRELEGLELRAGIDGVLQQMDIEPGKQVAAGDSIARVARQDVLIARLLVPELQAKDLNLGLAVQVDLRNAIVEGRIDRIDPAVRDGRVVVDIGFPGPLPASARPDLSVDGRIVVARLADTISIPRPAAAGANAAGSLFVLRSDDRAERVQVVYGAISSERVEIRSGLRTGDRVILSDTGNWAKHDVLQIE